MWIMFQKDVKWALHYLDNFIIFGRPHALPAEKLRALKSKLAKCQFRKACLKRELLSLVWSAEPCS